MKFAVYFGNRGFFPGELIASAISDFKEALAANGHEAIVMEGRGTRYDAVETPEEGRKFAAFLKEHEGEYGGIILSLPNFGDENGALAALGDVKVPILVQAYPDEIGSMDFAHRRDSVCGKLAMCNVLRQAGIRHSLTTRFAATPGSESFARDLGRFASICGVANGMRRVSIGVLGARTTAFKTVRVDEIALQRAGVNVETIDLSVVLGMMDDADPAKVAEKKALYLGRFEYPAERFGEAKMEALARFGVALDELVVRFSLDALAVRCWDELERRHGIAPCLAMAVLNGAGIPAACETDVANAVAMRAVQLACGGPVAVFDVNNNYGDAEDRAIMFHCSAVPGEMLSCKGCIGEHAMFRKAIGPETGVGVVFGGVKEGPVTLASLKTEDGRLCAFVTEGEVTGDPIEKEFFGTGFVFRKDGGNIDGMLNYMAENGYRHHVAFAFGRRADAIAEALGKYRGYDVEKV